MLSKYEWMLFIFSLSFALYWLMVAPIEFTGDSQDYLGLAHMILGKSAQGMMLPLYRTPGYSILMALTGAVIPGTFIPLVLIQALFAAVIPVIVYRILIPYGPRIAAIVALIVVLTGTTTVHASQIMSEQWFIFILFIGLSLAIRIIRDFSASQQTLFYWLAITFAAMNMVRPIAWPIFWLILLTIVWDLRYDGRLTKLWKSALGSALLFMIFMTVWGLLDDVFMSSGARYSPLVQSRVSGDSRLQTYLYDLPFNEAYFDPWKQRVKNITKDPTSFGTLKDRPAMAKIRNIVLQQIINDQNMLLRDQSKYPYQLFGKFANQPKQLVDRIFTFPNYVYANYVHSAVVKSVSKKDRLTLYYAAAEEAGRSWPKRWLALCRNQPLLSFTGPSSGTGVNQFLLAYTSLRHSIPKIEDYNYNSLNPSAVNEKNGPATRFLFTTLTEALRNNPELWRGTNPFGLYVDKPEELTNFLITHPSLDYSWSIEVMLWDLMGYHTMSLLVDQVANETFSLHVKPHILRAWVMVLMVVAGPGYVNFDDIRPEFAPRAFWAELETSLMTDRQKQELQTTQRFNHQHSANWLVPVQWGYFLFYLCKPLFLLTSVIILAILWSRKRPMVVPLVLMLPYLVSVAIYGWLFTAQPRYTDPTLLLPFIVTCMGLPECLRIWKERQYKTRKPVSEVLDFSTLISTDHVLTGLPECSLERLKYL